MRSTKGDRVFGVETEFGCLVTEIGSPDAAVEAVKDVLFRELRIGVLDVHSRDDVFEPPECGGFLVNGSRLYVDAVGSHLEYATAECRGLRDLVANDRAGQRHILRGVKALGFDDAISFYNNSVDHFGGHTFGCHENYLVSADEGFLANSLRQLLAFLATRQIFAGVGRVGGHILSDDRMPTYRDVVENPIDYIWVSHVYGVSPDPTVQFQLSQRADHILKPVASRVRFNRAIINPKWEHFYTHGGKTRLHLLFGEANQSDYAYALKVGTTALVLKLLERSLAPSVSLASPVGALRSVSRDPTYRWLVELEDGSTIPAIDLQRLFLAAAEDLRGEDQEADWVLDEWKNVLDVLETDPLQLGDKLDWVAKLQIVERYREAEGLDWGDDALHSIDLEYHNIDPDRSLHHAWMSQFGSAWRVSELEVLEAMTEPPPDTRAKGRAQRVCLALRRNAHHAMFDWNGVSLERLSYEEMPDPLQTYELSP